MILTIVAQSRCHFLTLYDVNTQFKPHDMLADCVYGAAGESHWVRWSTKTGFRVAAEVVSLLVEIGGLCSLQFFFCSQFATAVLTTSFASGIETLIDTCSNELSMSFFSLFLSRVLILLTALTPLSGQALVIAADRATSASSTMSG